MNTEARVEVELDVFSGRPNPRWMLDDETTHALRSVVSQRAQAQSQDVPGLGYRGFLINNLSGNRDLPPKVRVYNGMVTVLGPDHETYLEDNHDIERLLLDRARQLGYGDVIDRFHIPQPKDEHSENNSTV